ncbi:hypothetical protein SDC9_171726 [bioreactor metagenome]|uniref:Uncharacterized protein n=1 Tax=bioreactor metagenome TaxID=1076179 RepID=A0A645GEX1_9ZZZZ
MHRRHFFAPEVRGILEGPPQNPLTPGPGENLNALGRVRPHHVLDPGVEVLHVLPHDDHIDPLVPGRDTGNALHRPQIDIELQLLAQCHIDRAKPGAKGRCHGAL